MYLIGPPSRDFCYFLSRGTFTVLGILEERFTSEFSTNKQRPPLPVSKVKILKMQEHASKGTKNVLVLSRLALVSITLQHLYFDRVIEPFLSLDTTLMASNTSLNLSEQVLVACSPIVTHCFGVIVVVSTAKEW